MRPKRSSAGLMNSSTGWSSRTCASGSRCRRTWLRAAPRTATASSAGTATSSGSTAPRLIQSVGQEAQRVVDTYDKRAEARALAESARNAVAAAAATGVGALGLGAIVTMAASTAAADITGLVMASVVGAIGFFIIPAKRRRAKQEMREKIAAMRTRLSSAIRTEFESETTRSGQRIRESIAPYARFVRAESEKLTSAKAELGRHRGELQAMQARIEALR